MIEAGRRAEFEQITIRVSPGAGHTIQRHFRGFHPVEAWNPDVNIYQLEGRIEVCVDLAGVQPESVEVHVTAEQLSIRGIRQAPDPRPQCDQPMRIIAMEIDHGPFCRTIRIPDRINYNGVRTEYVNGMLWIRLPMRTHA